MVGDNAHPIYDIWETGTSLIPLTGKNYRAGRCSRIIRILYAMGGQSICRPYCARSAGGTRRDQMIEEKSFITCAGEWNGMTIPGSYPVCDSGFDSRSCNVLVSLRAARGGTFVCPTHLIRMTEWNTSRTQAAGFVGSNPTPDISCCSSKDRAPAGSAGGSSILPFRVRRCSAAENARRSQAEWQPAFNRYITGSNPVACI